MMFDEEDEDGKEKTMVAVWVNAKEKILLIFLFFGDDDDNDFVVEFMCDVCEVMEDDREVLFKVGGMLF